MGYVCMYYYCIWVYFCFLVVGCFGEYLCCVCLVRRVADGVSFSARDGGVWGFLVGGEGGEIAICKL